MPRTFPLWAVPETRRNLSALGNRHACSGRTHPRIVIAHDQIYPERGTNKLRLPATCEFIPSAMARIGRVKLGVIVLPASS